MKQTKCTVKLFEAVLQHLATKLGLTYGTEESHLMIEEDDLLALELFVAKQVIDSLCIREKPVLSLVKLI